MTWIHNIIFLCVIIPLYSRRLYNKIFKYDVKINWYAQIKENNFMDCWYSTPRHQNPITAELKKTRELLRYLVCKVNNDACTVDKKSGGGGGYNPKRMEPFIIFSTSNSWWKFKIKIPIFNCSIWRIYIFITYFTLGFLHTPTVC